MTDLEVLIKYVHNELKNLKITASSTREKMAACSFVLAIDHADSIALLLSQDKSTSAFSLLRVQFEAFVRGAWLLHCASDKQVTKLLEKDKLEPTFHELVNAVDTKLKLSGKLLNLKSKDWSTLNSLTHTGAVPLKFNFDGESFRSLYDGEHKLSAISYVTYFLRMSLLSLCELSDISPSQLKSSYEGFCALSEKCI